MKQVKQILLTLAEYYGHDMSESVLELYVEVFKPFSIEQITEAAKRYMLNTDNTRFPIPPHKIMDIYKAPKVDDRDIANELARKIYKSVFDFGWVWEQGYFSDDGNYWQNSKKEIFSSFKECVINELGEIAWRVILSRGGWSRLVESTNECDEGMFIAQLRDHIKAMKTLSDAGIDVTKIGMKKTEGLQAPTDFLKLLTQQNDTKL